MPPKKVVQGSESLNEVNAQSTTAPAASQEQSLAATAPALEQVAGSMPAPNPDVAALPPPVDPTEEAHEKTFDPAIHEVDESGKPILTPTGRYKKKKGTRKLNVPMSDTVEDKKSKMVAAQRLMAASVIVDTFINTGVMVLGPEWLPEVQVISEPGTGKELGKISERDTLVETTNQYMAAKGINDIPPGMCLTLVVSAYCLKRVQKPETQKRLAFIFGGFRAKVGAFFGKIKGMFAKKK